jgi:hypothetical protein
MSCTRVRRQRDASSLGWCRLGLGTWASKPEQPAATRPACPPCRLVAVARPRAAAIWNLAGAARLAISDPALRRRRVAPASRAPTGHCAMNSTSWVLLRMTRPVPLRVGTRTDARSRRATPGRAGGVMRICRSCRSGTRARRKIARTELYLTGWHRACCTVRVREMGSAGHGGKFKFSSVRRHAGGGS